MKNLIQKTILIVLFVGLSACSSKLFKHNDSKQRAVSSAAFSKLNIVDDFMALNLMNTQVADAGATEIDEVDVVYDEQAQNNAEVADAEATEIDEVDVVYGEQAQNNAEVVVASATDTVDKVALDAASSEVVVPQSYVYVQIIAAMKAESVARALLFAQSFDFPALKIEQQQFEKVLIGPLMSATQTKQVLTQAQQRYADAFIVIASEPLIPN